jgi:hypothetical protein
MKKRSIGFANISSTLSGEIQEDFMENGERRFNQDLHAAVEESAEAMIGIQKVR